MLLLVHEAEETSKGLVELGKIQCGVSETRQQLNDEQAINQLFEDGDRALISGDEEELRRIYADDYVQYDESGKISSRQDLIRNLASGSARFIAMTSTGRTVRFFGNFAVVHGSEEDEIERDGKRISLRYMYMDLVIKRDDRWQIVASQLATPPS